MYPQRSTAGPPPATLRHAPSQLFTLRLWRAQLDDGRVEWRGQLQQVMGGQIRYFRDWPTLLDQLDQLLADTETPPVTAAGAEP